MLANQAFNKAVLGVPSYSTEASEAAVSMVGSVVSSMVNVAEVVAELLEPSVTVKATVTAPVAPHKSLKETSPGSGGSTHGDQSLKGL